MGSNWVPQWHNIEEKATIILFASHLAAPPLHTTSGYGKREAHIKWSMVTCKMATPVTGIALRTTDPAPADSRQ